MKEYNKEKGTEELLQWHSAFYAGIQIELEIAKKIAKGKSVAQIADELEETEESILPLYNQLIAEGQ